MNYIKYIFSFNTEDYLLNTTKKIKNKFYFKESFQFLPRNSNPSWVFNALTRFYVPIALGLLMTSPMEFLFFNTIILSILAYYKKIGWLKLLIINIFFIVIWVFFFGWYMHILTHEPSVPFYYGDRVELTPQNLLLIVAYSTQFPSIFRATFVETLILLVMSAHLFNLNFTLFFFV